MQAKCEDCGKWFMTKSGFEKHCVKCNAKFLEASGIGDAIEKALSEED